MGAAGPPLKVNSPPIAGPTALGRSSGRDFSPIATIVTAPHRGVMALRHGVAGIDGTIAPQIVVTRDLVGRQQGRRLDVAREVDEPQFGPGGGRCVDQGAQGVRRHAAIPEGRLNCRFGRNEALARLLRLSLHGGENVLDGRDLTGVQIQLGFQLEQMRRPGHAVQFGGKGQSPSAPEAQIFQINLRQALDLAAFQPGIGGMAVGLSEKVHGKGHGAKGESKAEHQETPEVFLLLSHLAAAPHMIMIMSEVFEDLFADAMERDFAAGERNLAQVERILRGLSDGEDAPEPITRAELAARLADDSVTVLDVRPADEYAAGHIPGALNATLSEIDGVVSMFDSTAEIVAYCRGPYCVYAHQAVAALRRHGLNARRLDGGLPEWREDGRKIASVS